MSVDVLFFYHKDQEMLNQSLRFVVQRRSVVYVRGGRVQGLVRDPTEVMTANGKLYAAENTADNIKHLKEYLQQAKVDLPDETLLQVLTHKSFAHGSKPYNERLAYFGEQLLQLTASKSVLGQSPAAVDAVNGVSFAAVGSLAHRMQWSDKFLADFAQQKGIDKVFFCKTASSEAAYKPKKIFSTITTSIIGAIAATHGKSVAENFITSEILPAYQKQ